MDQFVLASETLVVPVSVGGEAAAAYGRALALVGERTDLRVEPLAVLPPTGLRAALSRHLGSVRLAPGIRRVGVFLVDREVGPDLDGFASPLPVETRLVGRHGRVLEQEFAGSIPDDVNRPGELEPLSEGARFLRRFGRSSHAAICQALDVVAAEPRRARLHARDARARVVVRDSRRGFTPALVAAVAELGGWENLLDPTAEVVVKPNLHYHELYPSVTRPKALEAVLRQLLERGYRVRVVESSGPDTLKCAVNAGLLEVCRRLGVPFLPLELGDCVTLRTDFRQVPYVDVFRPFLEARNLVCLGLLKTHQIAGLTAACKHLFAAVGNRARLQVHQAASAGDCEPLHRLIAFLNRIISPRATLIDAHQALPGKGPGFFTGEATVSDEGLLLAGVDNLALDVWIRDYLDRRHPGWNPAAHPTVDYLTYLEAGVG